MQLKQYMLIDNTMILFMMNMDVIIKMLTLICMVHTLET